MACKTCSFERIPDREQYKYTESGLDNILIEDARFVQCRLCGEKNPLLPDPHRAGKEIMEQLRDVPLGADEVLFMRKLLGVRPDELALMLTNRGTPVSEHDVSLYENTDKEVPQPYQETLRSLTEYRLMDVRPSGYTITVTRT